MARPKKVVTAPLGKSNESPRKQFSPLEIEAALQITHSEYFMQVVALMSHLPEVKELTYVKVPLVTPNGGTYLVSILHVDGPKIDLQALEKAANEILSKEKKV